MRFRNATLARHGAIFGVALLFIYYEVYRWVPLGRWNWQFHFPVANDQFYPDIAIGLLLLWILWSLLNRNRVGMWTGSVLLTLWTVVHCLDWWIPYARNLASNAGRYAFYAPHTQLLPAFGNHYPPDAGHAVLDFILFPTCALMLAATVPRRNPPPPQSISSS